jgi:hypothetical protein
VSWRLAIEAANGPISRALKIRIDFWAPQDFSRIVDGKVAEHWAQFDVMGVLQQIGAVPLPVGPQ